LQPLIENSRKNFGKNLRQKSPTNSGKKVDIRRGHDTLVFVSKEPTTKDKIMAISYPVLEVTLNVTVEIEYDAEGKDEGIGCTKAEAIAEAQHKLGALGFVEYDAPVIDEGVEEND
jgi:hypothetical protein